VLGKPARRFGFGDDREDLDRFARDVMEHFNLAPNAGPAKIVRTKTTTGRARKAVEPWDRGI